MGMSLSAKAGYGVLIPLDGSGEDNPSERVEEVLDNYGLLTLSLGRWEDFIWSAAIFVASTHQYKWDGTPIALDVDLVDKVSRDEYENLRDVAAELEIPFDPKYITLVSYW